MNGGLTCPIEIKEIEAIQTFLAAFHQEGCGAETDYYSTLEFAVDNLPGGRPWRHRIDCSKQTGERFSFEVYKRPHSTGFFKGKFAYSVEVGEKHDGEITSLGFVADTSHIEALRKSLLVYIRQLEADEFEADALDKTGANMQLVKGR